MISIIIPVLNEAATINNLLEHLTENISGDNSVEIILVDGGSSDGTQKRILEFSKSFSKNLSTALRVTILTSEKGRAKQMNKGARKASGEILVDARINEIQKKLTELHQKFA